MSKTNQEVLQDLNANPANVVKEGWLAKKGALRHNWKDRWFVLYRKQSNKKLIYFESERKRNSNDKIKSYIDLEDALCVGPAAQQKNRKGVNTDGRFWDIVCNHRTYALRAQDSNASKDWMEAVQGILPNPQPLIPRHQGLVFKKGYYLKKFRKRYMVLAQKRIYYFSRGDKVIQFLRLAVDMAVSNFCRGFIPLDNATVKDVNVNGKDFTIQISSPGRTFVLAFKNAAEKATWMKMIKDEQDGKDYVKAVSTVVVAPTPAENANEEKEHEKKEANVPLLDKATLHDLFFQAITSGNIVEVNKYLAQGADINYPDAKGYQPLRLAVRAKENRAEVVAVLLKHKPDLNHQDPERGVSALIMAALSGYVEIVHLLLDAGADPHIKSRKGFDALAVAKRMKYMEVVKLLEDKIMQGAGGASVTPNVGGGSGAVSAVGVSAKPVQAVPAGGAPGAPARNPVVAAPARGAPGAPARNPVVAAPARAPGAPARNPVVAAPARGAPGAPALNPAVAAPARAPGAPARNPVVAAPARGAPGAPARNPVVAAPARGAPGAPARNPVVAAPARAAPGAPVRAAPGAPVRAAPGVPAR